MLKCGESKKGAWKVCGACQFTPKNDTEKAQHLFLSTHFNSEKKLQVFSEHIKSGKDVTFKEKDLQLVTTVLDRKQKNKKEQRLYLMKLCGVFALTIIIMISFYYYSKVTKNPAKISALF